MATKRKGMTLHDYLAQRLRNPRFRRAWAKVKEENRLTRQLVRLRIEQGLTQAQVAEMLGTRQSVISRLEHKPPSHSTDLLRRVARVYGCEVKDQVGLVPKA